MSISNLVLNFAPLTLSGEMTLNIGYYAYDEDRLTELRAEFGQTHVFKRDVKDDKIVETPHLGRVSSNRRVSDTQSGSRWHGGD